MTTANIVKRKQKEPEDFQALKLIIFTSDSDLPDLDKEVRLIVRLGHNNHGRKLSEVARYHKLYLVIHLLSRFHCRSTDEVHHIQTTRSGSGI
jgi:hypothetical protein